MFFFTFLGVLLLCYLAVSYNNKTIRERQQLTHNILDENKQKIDNAFNTGQINDEERSTLLNAITTNYIWLYNFDVNFVVFLQRKRREAERRNNLKLKYGEEIGERLINHQYWIGMTEEQLLDSKGRPTKVETQVLQTKTKKTYIYGNKSSGDYFVLENGLVTKFVDR